MKLSLLRLFKNQELELLRKVLRVLCDAVEAPRVVGTFKACDWRVELV